MDGTTCLKLFQVTGLCFRQLCIVCAMRKFSTKNLNNIIYFNLMESTKLCPIVVHVNIDYYSEVCHYRCVFKLHGELNSTKNTTLNIWVNDGVY